LPDRLPPGVTPIPGAELNGDFDWTRAVTGVDTVIHTAARVHVMKESTPDPLAAFLATNVEGTLRLARQAAAAGVKRFVFVSSVKVNGEATLPGRPFRADDSPAPMDAYGLSKLQAEKALRELGERTGMQIVVVRPPLVYGPGVRANFLRLLKLVRSRAPMPLGSVRNARSMVALDNLADFLCLTAFHPAAAERTFLVSDDHDMSTPELVRLMGAAMRRQPVLIPVPVALLTRVGRLTGLSAEVSRLVDSLQVDIAPAKQLLDWKPVQTADEAIARTVQSFLKNGG